MVLAGILSVSGNVLAQIDQERMDKDLRVSAKVLESLMHDNEGMMMYSNNVEANYLEGYGVIFSVGSSYSFYVGKGGKSTFSWTYPRTERDYRRAVVVAPKADDKEEKSEKQDKENKEKSFKDLSDAMVEFLVDYSQMINQLKPSDKITVSTKKSDYVYVGSGSFTDEDLDDMGQAGITVQMVKKDHNDYIAGKLSREDLIAKIEVNKKDGAANRSKDLDLFSSMLGTVYEDSYTDSYFISWDPEYERLEGVGAIYSFKVYSSYDEDGLYRMPSIDKRGLASDERNAQVEKLYPVFLKSMKENMIQYGRTINSLNPDELLILKITLTKCDGCSIPKKIQLSVKQSVLSDYNTGKLSEKDAVAKVKMTEL